MVGSLSEGEQEQEDWDIWRVEALDPAPVVVVVDAVAGVVAAVPAVAAVGAAGTLFDHAEAVAGFEEDGNQVEGDHDLGVADHGQEEWDRDQDDEYGVVVVVVQNILADFDFDTLETCGPVDKAVVVQNQDWNTEELG